MTFHRLTPKFRVQGIDTTLAGITGEHQHTRHPMIYMNIKIQYPKAKFYRKDGFCFVFEIWTLCHSVLELNRSYLQSAGIKGNYVSWGGGTLDVTGSCEVPG